MVVRIGNDDTVGVRNGYVMRMFELAFLLATAAKFTDEGAVRLEYLQDWIEVFHGPLVYLLPAYLNAMIFLITNIDEA